MVNVHIKQQAAVVVEHRRHSYYGHCVIIYERSEIAEVPVGVEYQRIEHAHSAEAVTGTYRCKIIEHGRNRALTLWQKVMCFSKSGFLTREQRTLAYQLIVIIRDVIRNIVHMQLLCELARKIFRQRFYFKRRTSAFVEHDPSVFPYPAFREISVRPKLWRCR